MKYFMYIFLLCGPISSSYSGQQLAQLSLSAEIKKFTPVYNNDFLVNKNLMMSPNKDYINILGKDEFLYSISLDDYLKLKSFKYGVSSILLKAILITESNLITSAVRCRPRCTDFGLGQINIRNVKKLKLDINRLLSDVNYNLDESLKILSQFKKSHPLDKAWFVRYNVGSRKSALKTKAAINYCMKLEKNSNYKIKCLRYL